MQGGTFSRKNRVDSLAKADFNPQTKLQPEEQCNKSMDMISQQSEYYTMHPSLKCHGDIYILQAHNPSRVVFLLFVVVSSFLEPSCYNRATSGIACTKPVCL